MNKALIVSFAILIATQLNFVKNNDNCFKDDVDDADVCKNLEAIDGYKCCLFKWKYDGGSFSRCDAISNEDYDDLDDFIASEEEDAKIDPDDPLTNPKLTVDCSANYLLVSLLLLFLLFF